MVVRNTRLTTAQDFNCLRSTTLIRPMCGSDLDPPLLVVTISHRYALGDLYVQSFTAENYVRRSGHSSRVFLAGDLSMRLGMQE